MRHLLTPTQDDRCSSGADRSDRRHRVENSDRLNYRARCDLNVQPQSKPLRRARAQREIRSSPVAF